MRDLQGYLFASVLVRTQPYQAVIGHRDFPFEVVSWKLFVPKCWLVKLLRLDRSVHLGL